MAQTAFLSIVERDNVGIRAAMKDTLFVRV